ncbi:unnamed protein product [Musa acuminata subsp. malaccensis]|uniref:(wild Malaysian banana) hypothetical protein n=1 Tax=Musa acuminata subsp. malaccensis TaxID=214687 RepID=A0A804L1D2_MUSAM|nr:PREDICTED: uncharacterized protein LOC103969479 [Musa acuminata subsp. malaccensis]CAG1854879.1 unnamed protein product [Musa acuminata subsp. malaccensis]
MPSEMEKQPPPLIVAMKGHPGTGKSTLARAISAALACPLLDKDDVRDCTLPVQHALSDTGTAVAAAGLLNDLSYSVIWRLAATQLRLGLSVVVDSPLSRRAHLDRLLDLAHGAAAAGVVVVECRPKDAAEWRRRLEARGAAAGSGEEGWHKPGTWEDLQRLLEGYQGCTDFDVSDVPRLVVDTTAADEMVATVLEFIRSAR